MASITLSSPAFFRNGVGGASSVVGVESKLNRVARYSFVAPATGANAVSLSFAGMWFGNGTRPDSFRFYIGTDSNSHINAGADTACTGTLAVDSGGTVFSGAADILLLPSTTYYLFVFPNTATFGWYNWEGTAAMECAGGSYSVPTLSASAVTMGSALTVYTNRHSDSFTHTLTYQFGDASGTIAANVGASCAWTPSVELARQIPNADKGVGTIYCTTYQGGVQIGTTQQVALTLTVPDTVVPTVTATWADSSPAFAAMGTLVKLVSALAVDVAGVGAYGSTVTAASMTLNGKAYTGGTVMDAGELPLIVTVKDSRGRSGSVQYTLSVADYAAPALTLDASRCTADGTSDDTGEYCRVTLCGTTVQVNGQNTATLAFQYGGAAETVQVDTGAFTYEQIVPAPSTQTLSLSATLTDKLLSAARSFVLSVGYATLDLLQGGRGIAFGTTATKEGFTCAMDVEFLGSVGGVIADYVVEQGREGVWTWRKWNSGTAECWGRTSFTLSTTASGTYFQGVTNTILFPSGLFADVPIPTWSHYGNSYINSNISWLNKNGCGLLCNTAWALTDTAIDCWMQVKGVWK